MQGIRISYSFWRPVSTCILLINAEGSAHLWPAGHPFTLNLLGDLDRDMWTLTGTCRP